MPIKPYVYTSHKITQVVYLAEIKGNLAGEDTGFRKGEVRVTVKY